MSKNKELTYKDFIKAIEKNDIKTVAQYLEQGINVNINDPDHPHPIHIAVLGGHLDMTKLLLENGANVNAIYTKTFPGDWDAYDPLDVDDHYRTLTPFDIANGVEDYSQKNKAMMALLSEYGGKRYKARHRKALQKLLPPIKIGDETITIIDYEGITKEALDY